ncbi:hypothetical protein SMA75_20345 [Escherichia coli]|uniref:hypothetical protein n=1 Tax=Escherichia coli TaxID=562 RepID=UPI00307ABBEA
MKRRDVSQSLTRDIIGLVNVRPEVSVHVDEGRKVLAVSDSKTGNVCRMVGAAVLGFIAEAHHLYAMSGNASLQDVFVYLADKYRYV